MPRAKKVVETPKRRGRPPKKQAPSTTAQVPKPGPGYKYRWISEQTARDEGLIMRYEPDPAEIQAIELALVRLRRIASTLRLASMGMDSDQADAVNMSSQLVDGAHEAIAEAVAMIREQLRTKPQ